VELPQGFWLGQTEVTNEAYHRVVPAFSFSPSEARLPAVGLSRVEAKAYCAAVGGRLPTEAEWEYAARGGTTGAYYGVPSKIAWYGANSDAARHPVASLQPNAYGLYDTLGNASEWVLDRYYNKYDIEAPAVGDVEQPVPGNATAVTRGGFWESEAANVRVSRRSEQEKDEPVPMAGVRCVAIRK
jgi:formylglycine-generating enzyme required for sulfatase activity